MGMIEALGRSFAGQEDLAAPEGGLIPRATPSLERPVVPGWSRGKRMEALPRPGNPVVLEFGRRDRAGSGAGSLEDDRGPRREEGWERNRKSVALKVHTRRCVMPRRGWVVDEDEKGIGQTPSL